MFRAARVSDLPALVAMLTDDKLGQQREAPGLPLHTGYLEAFEVISRDLNSQLLV